MEEVIVIVGPTCSGKTKLSLFLAEQLGTEIISADSRQVFKYLDIGTAKPTKDELEKIKHHFISQLNPNKEFNASIFAEQSEKIIRDLINQKKIPLVVGGSGLYIKALIDGITESADTNKILRQELLEKRRQFGNEYLFHELQNVDEISASKMLPQNWKRVIRALEVYKLTGKPIWHHHQAEIKIKEFNYNQFGLLWDRGKLYKNIEHRVDEMIENGLVREVEEVLNQGFSKELNSLNTVGYKEIIQYLNGRTTLEKAIELIKRNSRRYAKRQMTWFNADKRIKWFKINSISDLNIISEKIVEEINERKN